MNAFIRDVNTGTLMANPGVLERSEDEEFWTVAYGTEPRRLALCERPRTGTPFLQLEVLAD